MIPSTSEHGQRCILTTWNTSVNANASPIDIQILRLWKCVTDPSLNCGPLSESAKLLELATQQRKQVKAIKIKIHAKA